MKFCYKHKQEEERGIDKTCVHENEHTQKLYHPEAVMCFDKFCVCKMDLSAVKSQFRR